MRNVEKTLLQQLRITDLEIDRRKKLLEFDTDDVALLVDCKHFIREHIDPIVDEFYTRQIEIEENAILIGDAETLQRLKTTMRAYVLALFDGTYDLDYVNNRLRVGLVHKRIGVSPKLYLSATNTLIEILQHCISENLPDRSVLYPTLRALQRLLNFDTQLVFDTYLRSLVSEIESTRDNLESYALDLEEKVAERTRELSELARRDQLTGLFNRRAFQKYLKRDLASAERSRTPLCLIYFDVDGFKEINDTEGHPRGDEILATIGETMLSTCRETDIPCRYGGDEFCIILPNSVKEQANEFARRLDSELKSRNGVISISVGIVQTGPDEYDDLETFLKKADDLMYSSKRKQRPAGSTKDPFRIDTVVHHTHS